MTPFSATRRRILGLAAVATMGLGACSLGQPAPSDHFYRLDIDVPAASAYTGATAEGRALVAPFEATGVLNQRALLWTENGVELQQYSYHFWAEPPARMFQEATVNALRATDAFEAVVQLSYRQRPEWVVQGGIQKLEVIGENSAVRGARVALSFLVRDEDGGRVLMDRTYEETASVPGGTVASAVVAIGDATETILTRFLHDLSDVELVKAESPRRR